jgi:hypothetical protein
MAVVLTFSWPEITADVYDAVRKKVRREEDAPDGCVLHAAWFVDGSLNVMDIWESEDHFNRFIEARIAPRYLLRGPARGPLASGPGMTVAPCRTDDLGGGVTGPGRCRRRR